MTLINYLTRVHFADGVLEEAIHSEMEANGKRRPLIIAEEGHLTGATAERFFSSFPRRSRAEVFSDVPLQATETAARRVAELYRDGECDLIIAFGSNRAMDLAKVSRIAITFDEPIAALSNDEGGSQRINGQLPLFFSVPGILGFASAISDYTRVKLDAGGQVLLSSRHLIPVVTICDPTLTLGASATDSATAAAGILARSIDSFLSPSYNPPADAMAVDALARVTTSAARAIADDDLKARREMMAGGLNSSLSLQKGLCVVHAICNAIASASSGRLDPSTLGGVMIPRLVDFYGELANGRAEPLRKSLNIASGADLSEGVEALMSDWPMPRRLSDLGVDEGLYDQISVSAAADRAIDNGPRRFTAEEIRKILASAH